MLSPCSSCADDGQRGSKQVCERGVGAIGSKRSGTARPCAVCGREGCDRVESSARNVVDLAGHLRGHWSSSVAVRAARAGLSLPSDARGLGGALGVIDVGLDGALPDLARAELCVRAFTRDPSRAQALCDHGTCSVTLLAAQGESRLRGIVPRARVWVATVADAHGVAPPARVAEALGWMVSSGVAVVAIPLGEHHEDRALSEALDEARAKGGVVFAASGNTPNTAVMFPARHRAVRAVSHVPRDGVSLVAPGLDVPALGADGRVSLRRGSSIACVVAAGLYALRRAAFRGSRV